MPTLPPAPVDIDCLLRIAQARRQRMRTGDRGDGFRAAMAILKQEKERMRGTWSLDSVYEWPDDDEDDANGFPPPLVEGRSVAQRPGGEIPTTELKTQYFPIGVMI